jgi:hypothetical protein
MLTRQEFEEYSKKFSNYFDDLKSNKKSFGPDDWWSLQAMTPQKRGNFMQDTHIEKMDGSIKKIAASLKRGDFCSKGDDYFEYKFSMTDSKRDICFLQIRPHHDCDYVFEVYDNVDEKLYCFFITKKQMKALLKKHTSSFTHSSTTKMFSLRGSLNNRSKKFGLWSFLIKNNSVQYDDLKIIYEAKE